MQAQLLTRATAWAELNTVTSFDAGTTHPVDSMSEKKFTVQNIRSFSPSSLLVESLIEHLCRLLEKDPANQKNLYKVICGKLHQMKLIDQTYGLEEFESLRGYYQKALLHLVTVAKSTVDGNEANSIVKLSNANLELSPSILKEEQLLHWSRYSTDYVELKFIAKGGFGQVFKARNKLDGEEYAVKKIFLRYRNLNNFYRNIQEVKLLAKLNHPNIVSYKAAWLEPLYSFTSNHISPQESELEDISNVSVSRAFAKPVLNHVETEESSSIIFKDNDSEKKTEASTQGAVVMEKHNEMSSTTCVHNRKVSELFQQSSNGSTSGASSMFRSEAAFTTMDNIMTEGHKEDRSVDVKALRKEKAVCRFMIQAENTNQDSNIQHEWAVLYIQMQLCSSTLRDWLNERNATLHGVNVNECLRIFHDIVLGVQYIHSQGIVHHDIKPNNIFVNGAGPSQIQVGDFGLACFLHHSSDDVTLIASHNHRGEFGTRLYAAPEQLEGKCDIKSDIYSLGIILFELLCPFRTDMERSLVLTKLRNGIFPSEMDEQNPELMQLIRKLMLHDVQERPSAQDILILLESLTKNVLTVKMPSKDDEYCREFIEQLREELVRKNQEIEELRKKVQALESTSNKE